VKTITLQIFGYDSDAIEIEIAPNDTALDILTKAGLEDCYLISNAPPHNYFSPEEALYTQLRDGESLYAQLPEDDE